MAGSGCAIGMRMMRPIFADAIVPSPRQASIVFTWMPSRLLARQRADHAPSLVALGISPDHLIG